MTVERIKGEIVFVCDACDEHLETGSDDFKRAGRARQDEGWRAESTGNKWRHLCPTCRP